MLRLLPLFFVGCGISAVRLQPHETIVESTFALPGVLCTSQPIVFDATFARADFLQSAGLDLKAARAKKANLALSATLGSLEPRGDCAPHGLIQMTSILLTYDYVGKDGGVPVSKEYSCVVQLDFGGDTARMMESINLCMNQVAVDTQTGIDAINNKPATLH